MATAPRVAVCVTSYRRPDGLFALLGALDALAFEGPAPQVRVVVVDNDADGSARAVCDEARSWLRHPLCYVVEKRLGIPSARNAAVAAALDSDWIAFVDDDEMPEPGWLDELLRAAALHGADVVTGPVAPRFQEPPPRWIAEGRFFESQPLPQGAPRETAYTNNVLVRTSRLAALDRLFDERLTPNGEDTELFSRLALGGARIVWAPRALVYEHVPPERATLGWLLRRSFHCGVAVSRIARMRRGLARAVPHAVAHAGWCMVRGLITAAVAPLGGGAMGARGLWLASFGLGRLAGLTV